MKLTRSKVGILLLDQVLFLWISDDTAKVIRYRVLGTQTNQCYILKFGFSAAINVHMELGSGVI